MTRTVEWFSTQLNIDDNLIRLTNIYAPNQDNERRIFFRQLHTYCSTQHTNILGGDFNCITRTIDKRGGDPNPRQTSAIILEELTSTHNLTDIWRQQHRRGLGFTWTGFIRNMYIQTRLDKFYVTDSIEHTITHSSIIPFAHSDHDAVLIHIDFNKTKRDRDTGTLTIPY